jgi:hypothetical protein
MRGRCEPASDLDAVGVRDADRVAGPVHRGRSPAGDRAGTRLLKPDASDGDQCVRRRVRRFLVVRRTRGGSPRTAKNPRRGAHPLCRWVADRRARARVRGATSRPRYAGARWCACLPRHVVNCEHDLRGRRCTQSCPRGLGRCRRGRVGDRRTARGLLTQLLGWEAIFSVNVPLATATAVLALWLVPADGARVSDRRFDLPGAISATAGVTLLIFALGRGSAARVDVATDPGVHGARHVRAHRTGRDRATQP